MISSDSRPPPLEHPDQMDNLTPAQRTRTMRSVKSRNTSAELVVRALCRELGEPGYRVHRDDLPGKPDLAFVGRRKAIFVHGCFWHGHTCRAGAKRPKTNPEYWEQKIGRNRQRDSASLEALAAMGWAPLVIWECELRTPAVVRERLRQFLARPGAGGGTIAGSSTTSPTVGQPAG